MAFRIDGEDVATEPAAVWQKVEEHLPDVRELRHEKNELESEDLGRPERRARGGPPRRSRAAELKHGKDSKQYRKAVEHLEGPGGVEARISKEEAALSARAKVLAGEMARFQLVLDTSDGQQKVQELERDRPRLSAESSRTSSRASGSTSPGGGSS